MWCKLGFMQVYWVMHVYASSLSHDLQVYWVMHVYASSLCHDLQVYWVMHIYASSLCHVMHVYGNMQVHYAKLCKSNMLCMFVVICKFIMYVMSSSLFLSFMRYYEYVSDRMTLGGLGKT